MGDARVVHDNHAITAIGEDQTCRLTSYQLPEKNINQNYNLQVQFFNIDNVKLVQLEILDQIVGSNTNTISQKSNNILVR